jgi:hypothetical protein
VVKVFLATFYMTGEASQCYTLLERNMGTLSWDEFVQLVNQCFGPLLRSNQLNELIQLHREGTVAEYQSKSLSLLARCTDFAEKHQINIFMSSLRNPQRTDVELENPAMLEDAMALARIYEQRLAMGDDAPTWTSPGKPRSSKPPVKPLLLPAPSTPPGTKALAGASTPSAPHLKHLTVAEMATKHEKGECYNCT